MSSGNRASPNEMASASWSGWTDEIFAKAKALWNEGALGSTAICQRVGCSKNALVGMAHRNGWRAKASAIRRRDPALPPAGPVVQRAGAKTLPDMSAPAFLAAVAAVTTPAHCRDNAVAMPAPRAPAPAPLPPAPPPQAKKIARAGARCCWPCGEPRTASFHFCDAEALATKPYCAEHASRAYEKVRDRREAVA
jgi:GcrA cell cycle regulator